MFQACQSDVKIDVEDVKIQRSRLAHAGSGALDGCFIHQHDRYIVLHGVDPVALPALQALRILPVIKRLLARGTNQNFQQILGNHVQHCTPRKNRFTAEVTETQRKPSFCFSLCLCGELIFSAV
jgi:hypothetical protein